jgi:Dolichyl-phosphate-mannose-protein mannosyltransferase
MALWLALDPSWRWALKLFLVYRLLFSVWSAWVSSVYPYFVEEAAIRIWPINASLDYWLQRTLLWPVARYDVIWYVGIAEYGYGYKPGATAFHPLYPLLMGLLGRLLGGNYLLAGWLIAQVCCVAMLALLYRLVLLDHDTDTAKRATLFLLGSPLGFSFLLPYTESLLLLCIVGAFYAARRGRWWLAGLAGAGAALTKQPGVIVLLPLLWEFWDQQGDRLRARDFRPLIRPLLGLALTPLGLLAFLAYRATLGDIAFSWSDPSSFVGALLVTPSYLGTWGEYFSWPWINFQYAFEQLQTRPYFYLIINLFVMLFMLALVVYTILRQRRSYAIHSLLLTLMNLSIVYPLWPYMGIIRRFTIVFPMFIQLAVWGRSRAVTALILVVNTLLWVLISETYVRNAFVP